MADTLYTRQRLKWDHSVIASGADRTTEAVIRRAIGDVRATNAVLDELVVNMSVGDAKHEAIDNLFRPSAGRSCGAAAG